ncbi:MAG TPA: tyrosine-type recombinase/integrase [Candidatus Omnitrophota bacterium]|nr:tyrosine-type recombinase/integrase [Candidatus Omnitrophota bacterium]
MKKMGNSFSINTKIDQAEQLIKQYLQARSWGRYASGALNRSRRYYADFLGYLRTREKLRNLAKVDRRVISRYRSYLRASQRKANNDTGARFLAIQDFLMWLERRGVRFPGSVGSVELPERPATLPRTNLANGDIEKIVDSVETVTKRGLRDKTILELLSKYSIRAGEICNLTLGDVREDNQSVSIRSQRKIDNRVVTVSKETADRIKQYLESCREKFPDADKLPWLFLREEGTRMGLSHVSGVIQRYARLAGFKSYISGHMIRMAASAPRTERTVDGYTA